MTSPGSAVPQQDLIVIGAGLGAGDIVWMVQQLRTCGSALMVRGFLDDDAAKQGTLAAGLPVLGPLTAVSDFRDVRFVIGMASYRQPRLRLNVAARLGLPPDRYATLIHPTASVSPEVRMGVGCLVFQGAVIGHEARIGDHAFISPGCIVSHHAVVDEGATMAPASVLCGGAALGCGAYAGARAVITGHTTVGPGALASIGSVVVRDVPADQVVFGNPARLLRNARGGAQE